MLLKIIYLNHWIHSELGLKVGQKTQFFLFIDYSQNIKLGNMNFDMNTYVRFKKMCAKNCMSVILLLVEIDKNN